MDVVVNPRELVPGLLPAVCVKTGEPAEVTRKASFRYTPIWVWFLIPLGLVVALIAACAASTRVVVDFPVCRKVARDHRRRLVIAIVTLVGVPIACLFVASALHQSVIAWLALVSFGIGFVLVFRAQTWISGNLSKAEWLTLKGVDSVWAEQRQALVTYHSAAAYQQQAGYAQSQQDLGFAQQRAHIERQQPSGH